MCGLQRVPTPARRPSRAIACCEEAAELWIAERGNEPPRDLRSTKAAEAGRVGDLLGRAPVAKRLQAADVAGDRLGRQGGPQLEQPGAQLGSADRVERPRLAEAADAADRDHPIPLDGPRRGALGRPGGAEQVGRGP